MKRLLSTIENNSMFFFGCYRQFTATKPDPIVWRVIGREGNGVLVLSHLGVDAVPFNTEYKDISWVACSQRGWLNGAFRYTAFTEEERRCIIAVDRNNDTEDYVFSLNMTEALRYLPMAGDRICLATEHARNNGVYTTKKGHCLWWLRSETYTPNRAQIIERNGEIDTLEYIPNAGAEVDDPQIAVRPAMWLYGNTLVDFV